MEFSNECDVMTKQIFYWHLADLSQGEMVKLRTPHDLSWRCHRLVVGVTRKVSVMEFGLKETQQTNNKNSTTKTVV